MSNPIAPISHHWLDSSHITFGVVTGAIYGRAWKIEGSSFNGREPDDERYDFDLAAMDSYSGRAWCRFLCPLAALMHVYARFSRFAIVADKKKCISCSACTSICHQGIDVMSFANKGVPMTDPECVRCSACVQSCPTGVLTFGRVDRGGRTIALDLLPASPVQMREGSGR